MTTHRESEITSDTELDMATKYKHNCRIHKYMHWSEGVLGFSPLYWILLVNQCNNTYMLNACPYLIVWPYSFQMSKHCLWVFLCKQGISSSHSIIFMRVQAWINSATSAQCHDPQLTHNHHSCMYVNECCHNTCELPNKQTHFADNNSINWTLITTRHYNNTNKSFFFKCLLAMFTSQWEGRLIYSLSTMTTELESAYPWSVSLGLCSHNVSTSWLFCLLLRHTSPSAWSKIFFFSDNEFPVNCSSEMSVADWPILCLHFENYPQSIARCKQSLYQLTMLIHSVQFRKVDSSVS